MRCIIGTNTLLLLLYRVISTQCTSDCKLNVPKVLLPISNHVQIKFTLYVINGGCYSWSLSRPDIISIQPEFHSETSCSQKAVVRVLTREFSRRSVTVLANDTSTGTSLSADIIVDAISTLQIVSKTRVLYLGEQPQVFETRAQDSQGNEFTTLEGIEFQWSLENIFSESSEPVMRVMSFSESSYSTSQTIITLERLRKRGHIALLEGMRTGSSKIEVALSYPEYSYVSPAVLHVTIVENIVLEPSTAYMIPGDCLEFKLYQMQNGKQIEINIMSDRYTLVPKDNNIAKVSGPDTVCAMALGTVDIVVQDNQLTYKHGILSSELAAALLIVATPKYMTLTLLPFNSWFLTTGLHATIVPEIYTENDQKFLLGKNVAIVTKTPEDIFFAIEQRKNGTITGNCINVGSGSVTAFLAMDNVHFSHKDIMVENTLRVYPELYIQPDTVYLPWVPNVPRLSFNVFKAYGGDNNYVWKSTDTSIVQTTESGLLTFSRPGSAMVTVSMGSNEQLKASATVHLLIPEEIEILNVTREAEIFNELFLHIRVSGRLDDGSNTKKVLSSHCKYLMFEISPQIIFTSSANYSVKPHESACVAKSLQPIKSGYELVTVGLQTHEQYLETSYELCGYEKLKPTQPTDDEHVTLAIGSSYDVVFRGGPSSRLGLTEPLLSDVEYFSTENTVASNELYIFRVTCNTVGSDFLQLTVISEQLGCDTYNVSSKVTVSCQIPDHFSIIAQLKSKCPLVLNYNQLLGFPSSNIRFDINIFDKDGHIFQNATSIKFSWTFQNESFASFNGIDTVLLEKNEIDGYKIPIIHYMTVDVRETLGDVYGKGMMYQNYYDLDPVFTFSFLLSVVQRPFIEPKFLSLLNLPNNIGYLKAVGGSGYFQFGFEDVASISYNYHTRTAEVKPELEGSWPILVMDQCLMESHDIELAIQVINVESLEISGPLKIQQGNYEKIIIKLFDKHFNQLTLPDNMSLTELGVTFEISDHLMAEFDSLNSAFMDYTNNVIEVKLKGNNLGHFTIWAQLKELSSNSLLIQIFPGLEIIPRNLTLVVGAEYQITVSGGPSFDSYTQFLPADSSTIIVSDNAIVRGLKAGDTTLTIMAVGSQGEVYCKNTIEVHVVVLTGVSIVAPIAKLGVGNTMPVWAIGMPNAISPLLLGSISPSFQFHWHVSVPNIMQIRDTLQRTNIQVSSENKLSIRVHGLNPGRANIELHVSARINDRPYISFNSSITIVVVNFLEWTRPNINFKSILMAPNSAYSLKTNALHAQNHVYSLYDSSPDPVITISSDGFLKSGSNFGTTVVELKTNETSYMQQTLLLPIQVRPVHYLMINIGTVLESFQDMKSLPRGLYLNLTVSYHDQYGTEFFIAPFTKPSYECNIGSKVQVEYFGSNHSLFTSLASSGSVILRAYDELSHIGMEDYIKIPVDNYIVPNKTVLTVGEVICFWTPFASSIGTWSTESKVLNVKPNGIAVAQETGFASVTYSVHYPESSTVLASINFEVLSLQSYLIEPSTQKNIYNRLDSVYLIPVFLMNEKSRKEPYYYNHCNSSDILFEQFPFQCDLQYSKSGHFYPLNKIFSVHQGFDFISGSFVCVVKAITGPSIEINKIESNITLIVSNGKAIKERVVLNFYPIFTVSTNRIILNKNTPLGIINVYAAEIVLPSLFVELREHELITISTKLEKQGCLQIFVKLDFEKSAIKEKKCSLTISSILTEQDHEVQIEISDDDVHTASTLLETFWNFFIKGLLLSEFIPFFVVYSIIISLILAKFGFNVVNEPQQQDESHSINSSMSFDHDRSNSFNNSRTSNILLASPKFIRATSGSLHYRRSPNDSYSTQ